MSFDGEAIKTENITKKFANLEVRNIMIKIWNNFIHSESHFEQNKMSLSSTYEH